MKQLFSLVLIVIVAIACTRSSSNLNVGEAALGQSFLPSFDLSDDENPSSTKLIGSSEEEIDTALQISNYVRLIFQENSKNNPSGALWLGTYGRGAGRFDNSAKVSETTKKLEFYSRDGGLSGNEVRDIQEDSKGNLWIATNGGVSKYSGSYKEGKSFTNYTTRNGMISNNVWSILEDRDGIMWFGTDSGVVKYDPAVPPIKQAFASFPLPFADIKTFQGAYPAPKLVNKIFQDASGKIWFATNGNGVFYIDPSLNAEQNNKPVLNHLTEQEGLCNNFIHHIYQDKKGNIWFSSRFGGVSRYNSEVAIQSTGKDIGKTLPSFTNYTTADGLSSNFVWSVFEDRSGNFWFATAGGGVDFVDQSASLSTREKASCNTKSLFINYKKVNGLASNYVQSIMEDKKGNLWFATGDGISRYVPGLPVAEWALFTSYPSKMDGC